MERKSTDILGVRFDQVSLEEAKEALHQACDEKKCIFVVTPNPEMCLEASKNPSFRRVLRKAHLSIPDGFGILLAARFLHGKNSPLKERVTGTDLMQAFLKDSRHRRIFLLGSSEKVNQTLAAQLKNQGIHIVGNGSFDPEDTEKIREAIHRSSPEVLFVAYGAPRQELWIDQHLPSFPSVRVAIGVGGAFDFLSGEKKRASLFLQRLGLEWAYRLWIEPKRIGRIFRATLVFPFTILFHPPYE